MFPELHDLLERAIIDEPPMLIRDGGVIARGYDEELDQLRGLSENASEFLLDYEKEQKEKTRHSQPEGRLQPGAWLLH